MRTGIYMFTIKGIYAYVGQSINIDSRIEDHRRKLIEHRHENFSTGEDYSVDDFEFHVLAECGKEDLNRLEVEMYRKMSSRYIMLNKRECGLQGIAGENIVFCNNEIPSLLFKDGEFYIDENKIDRDGDFFCLSNLVLYIRNNSNSEIRVNNILNSHSFIDRINHLQGINISKERSTASQLKDIGIYKVKGARNNKKIYCNFNVFITFAYESCPQFAASICIMIGNSLIPR